MVAVARSERSEIMTDARTWRAVTWSAGGTLLGIVLSGPAAVALVDATHPQPPWHDARLFAQSYDSIQMLPYVGGILLVVAIVVLMSSIHAVAREEQKALSGAALALTAAFASLISFNYVVQTTFLPELARTYDEESAGIIGAFSMANPKSLAWGIEMWGWGFLGVATWLAAPVFHGSRLERATRVAFAVNGPVSIVGTVVTVINPGWVMTPAGLVAFGLWNVLLAAMASLALAASRRRLSRVSQRG